MSHKNNASQNTAQNVVHKEIKPDHKNHAAQDQTGSDTGTRTENKTGHGY